MTPPEPNQTDTAIALLYTIALLSVFLLTSTSLLMVLRRRRRLRKSASRKIEHTEHQSAWVEAGRRAPTPPASDDNDSVDDNDNLEGFNR